jgi:hypothetical protein
MPPPPITLHLEYVHKYVWSATALKVYRSISNDVLTIVLILYHETASLLKAYDLLDAITYCAKNHRDFYYGMICTGCCTHGYLQSFN